PPLEVGAVAEVDVPGPAERGEAEPDAADAEPGASERGRHHVTVASAAVACGRSAGRRPISFLTLRRFTGTVGEASITTKRKGCRMDFKLEVVLIPVADVDRAKEFYVERCGFHLDVDHRPSEDFRVVQITPPGSSCSLTVGVGITDAAPGSYRGTHL